MKKILYYIRRKRIEKVKMIIRKLAKYYPVGIYDGLYIDTSDDILSTVYKKGRIRLDINQYAGCFIVYGVTNEEYEELKVCHAFELWLKLATEDNTTIKTYINNDVKEMINLFSNYIS